MHVKQWLLIALFSLAGFTASAQEAELSVAATATADVNPASREIGEVAESVQITDVWVVFKTHFDIGYTDRVAKVLERYRGEMIEKALGVIEANQALPAEQRFSWTVPGWPLRHILGPLQTPDRRARIEKAIRDDAITVHAAPFTLHTESFDLEDLVRGLHYSAQIARDYGQPLPRSAKMTDVPEHGWVLATVLGRAGIEFIQIGCNSACQYPRVPRLFWWEGPDGTRVLCNYTPDYGSSLTPPQGWPSKNYLAMIMTGDNHGPPNAAEVEKIRQYAAKQLPGIRVHFGKLDDFLDAVKAEQPTLEVVRGETPDTWIHGLMAMPEATRIARNIRPLEPALDSLDTHLKLAGIDTPSLANALAEAYENSLLYGEHTWGMNGHFGGRDIYPLDKWKKQMPADRQEKFLQSFEDHRDYIRTTQAIVDRELKARLELLATNVNEPGPRTIIWNALPWARSGWVAVNGQRIYVERVPANGYVTISEKDTTSHLAAKQVPLSVTGNAVETPFYRATFDLDRGGLASLVEKQTGRELVDQSSPYVVGQFLHERFSTREVNHFLKAYSRIPGGWAFQDLGKPGMPEVSESTCVAISPGNWTLRVADHVVTLTAGDTRSLAKAYALRFSFDPHSPVIEVEWIVTDKTPDKTPEGGWLCFPFKIEKPKFIVGRPGSLIDPAKDIIPGANRHLLAVATGVSITGENGTGVTVCPLDSPLVSLEKPGLWQWSMDFVPHLPSVFVNLYNNMWNTNFPLWQEGSWSERVRFWPGSGLVVPSWEARVPLLVATADGPAGKLPKSLGGLSVSRPGVLVTAFGDNPDGKGTLLRVWEQTGESGNITVTIPGRFQTATPVNLRGKALGAAQPVQENRLTLDLSAYAPASFVLE